MSDTQKSTMVATSVYVYTHEDEEKESTASADRGSLTTLCKFLTEDICEDWVLEAELLALSFATGIQDAASYPDYRCFAANQTGNTVFLAISVAGLAQGVYSFSNIVTSLCLFIGGGLVLGQMGNYFGVRKRIWLVTSNLLQTVMVLAAMIIQYLAPIRRDGPASTAVLGLLAFSSGGQVAMSRSLKIAEITTAMATAAYIDVMCDPGLLRVHNRARNRRVGFLVCLTAGCYVGAFALPGVNSPFALLLCVVVKTVVTVAFFFNRSQREELDCSADHEVATTP
ncbi:hypothetical protein VTN77DRAFT_5577 [Rasamsonia byssochlamydoides]|uniref:uncharacterized protein n=1 Tax=Rasamsonia byssochlamydoides TaxID=89139 RepID=UPI0037424E2C